MNKETIKTFRELAFYSSLGLTVALSIFIGLGIGVWLDYKVLGTKPICTFIFLGLGIAAGFRNILLAMKKSQRDLK